LLVILKVKCELFFQL